MVNLAVVVMMGSLDNVRSHAVRVVKEDGEGHHDDAVYDGGDAGYDVGFAHGGGGVEGGVGDGVKDPEDELSVVLVFGFGEGDSTAFVCGGSGQLTFISRLRPTSSLKANSFDSGLCPASSALRTL